MITRSIKTVGICGGLPGASEKGKCPQAFIFRALRAFLENGEKWESTTRNQVWLITTVGSNPTLSAIEIKAPQLSAVELFSYGYGIDIRTAVAAYVDSLFAKCYYRKGNVNCPD